MCPIFLRVVSSLADSPAKNNMFRQWLGQLTNQRQVPAVFKDSEESATMLNPSLNSLSSGRKQSTAAPCPISTARRQHDVYARSIAARKRSMRANQPRSGTSLHSEALYSATERGQMGAMY